MGYDAYVSCNCYKEGKCKPLPAEIAPLIFFEDYSQQARLTDSLDWANATEAERTEARRLTGIFNAWNETCCEHRNQSYFETRLANIHGLASFRNALAELGNEKFPVLNEQLPIANGGFVPLDAVPVLLEEVNTFADLETISVQYLLIDVEANMALQEYNPQREGVFLHAPTMGIDIGVDPQGFFIAQRHYYEDKIVAIMKNPYQVHQPRVNLFRSAYFQRLAHEDGSLEFVALDSEFRYIITAQQLADGETVMLNYGSPSVLDKSTKTLRAIRYRVGPDYFDYILTPLRQLCAASLATGNPIIWC